MEGWVKLHRKLSDNILWLSEPFTRGQAWVDLLMLANHEYSFFYKRGNKVEVHKGQIGRSEVELSDRWKWSRTKLRKFLNDLEKEQQIIQQKTPVTLIIEIVNYSKFQEKEQQTIQQKDSRKTAERQQKNTYKNVEEGKEGKEDKKKSIEKKKIEETTLSEIEDYFIENGYSKESASRFFKYYSEADWFDSKGNKVKNWKQKAQSVWFKPENKIQSAEFGKKTISLVG